MHISIKDLCNSLAASVTSALNISGVFKPSEISTDTRESLKDKIFIPLKGPTFDGHRFIESALLKGSKWAFCEEAYFENNKEQLKGLPLLLVQDTLRAYQQTAQLWRKKVNPTIIAITGSSGKTSTKEILYQLLSTQFQTHKTEGNFNNEIGAPKTLLELTPNHQVCLIEMGMRGLGQIKELAEIAQPDIGIITNVGPVHLSELGTIENVAKAKWELAEYLISHQGRLIVPVDNPYLNALIEKAPLSLITRTGEEPHADIQLVSHNKVTQEIQFSLSGVKHSTHLNLPGKHQALNLLNCIGAATFVPHFTLKQKHAIQVPAIFGRSETFHIKSQDITLINDAYNANPDSMKASLQVLSEIKKNPKIAVLGHMGELGENTILYHQNIGKFVDTLGLDALCVIGKSARGIIDGCKNTQTYFFESNSEAINKLSEIIPHKASVLFKASRSAQLENVLMALQKNYH